MVWSVVLGFLFDGLGEMEVGRLRGFPLDGVASLLFGRWARERTE